MTWIKVRLRHGLWFAMYVVWKSSLFKKAFISCSDKAKHPSQTSNSYMMYIIINVIYINDRYNTLFLCSWAPPQPMIHYQNVPFIGPFTTVKAKHHSHWTETRRSTAQCQLSELQIISSQKLPGGAATGDAGCLCCFLVVKTTHLSEK